MEATSAASSSRQDAFVKGLRKHLSRRVEPAEPDAPGVNGVRAGMELERLDRVREELELRADELERLLHVSGRTLQRRRRGDGRLTPAESDRLWRLLHVVDQATHALGSRAAARVWLREPKSLLRGETPIERLDTEPGLREVEDMLTVIDETSAA